MAMANLIASWSKDPDKQVGAVIVSPSKKQFTMGYNGLHHQMPDTVEILDDKQLKNELTIHAEINAIINAHLSIEGWTLYCTKAPCVSCALALIQAGITNAMFPPPAGSWYSENVTAIELLVNAEVTIDYYD